MPAALPRPRPARRRLLENAHGSQYRPLKFCLPSYLRLHPDNATHREELAEHYKRAMVALQLQVGDGPCAYQVLREC